MDNADFKKLLRGEIGRRFFLRGAAASAWAAAATATAWRLGAHRAWAADRVGEEPRARVVQIRSDHVVTSRGVHEELLYDLVESFLRRLAKTDHAAAAWKQILRPADERIALKFNQSGQEGVGTIAAMARVLVRSLGEAGVEASRIVAVGLSPALIKDLGVQAPKWGWSETVYDFGSGKDQLAAWVDEVDAIVNVPILMDHNIAQMSCGLMNLSHESIKHPAQFYENGCSPFIADIVALGPIRDRLRLTLVNALRVIFQGGPEAREDAMWDGGILFGGFDPVAVDVIGLQLLDHVREKLKLERIGGEGGSLPYLEAAEARGLGTAELYEIEIEKVKL